MIRETGTSGVQFASRLGREQEKKVAVLYENRAWLGELLDELRRRHIPFQEVPLSEASFLVDEPDRYALVINRASPSSYLRGHAAAIPYAIAFMETLEAHGRRVINGVQSFRLETSKVAQHLLFKRLGVMTPYTLAFNDRDQAHVRSQTFPFPAILKPNMGGSGAFVRKVETRRQLHHILDNEPDLFGPDHLLLLQRYIEPNEGAVTRLEFVDGELVYGMRVHAHNTFNLCPAEACLRTAADPDGEVPEVEFEYLDKVPGSAVAQAREILRAAALDVGGVEYVEDEHGQRYFYDINASSVYRPEIAAKAGVNAIAMLGDFIERELAKELVKRRIGRAAG